MTDKLYKKNTGSFAVVKIVFQDERTTLLEVSESSQYYSAPGHRFFTETPTFKKFYDEYTPPVKTKKVKIWLVLYKDGYSNTFSFPAEVTKHVAEIREIEWEIPDV